MSWLDYFRSSRGNSAQAAKERLQIVVAHERRQRGSPEWLPRLREDLLAVIRKYVAIDQDQVKVHLEKDGDYEILELNVTLPESAIR
jgi:cell division topological specificity factor